MSKIQMTLFLLPNSKDIFCRELEEEVEYFCESLETENDNKDKIKGILKGGLKLGKAGLQLTSKVHNASSQVAKNGILSLIKLKYPGLEDVHKAVSMVKNRVAVLT